MTLWELNNHFEQERKLQQARETLAALELAAYPGGKGLDGMPRSPGVHDKVGDLAVEIADLRARVQFLEEETAKDAEPINAFLSGIQSDALRIVFRLRFIRALSWGEVADIVGGGNSEQSVKMMCYRYLDDQGR